MTGPRRDVALVIGVAIAVRIWTWVGALHAPFWKAPILDESAYLDLARRMLEGVPPPYGAYYVAPGYAYFLALVFAAGGDPTVVKFLQLLCGIASTIGVWWIGRRAFGRGVALAAALVWAVLPAMLLQEILILKTALAVALVLGALAALTVSPATVPAGYAADSLWRAPVRDGLRRWCIAGVLLGGAVLLRAEFAVLAVVLAGAGVAARWRRWPGATPVRAPLACLGLVAACMAVPTLENARHGAGFVPVAYGGGPNFYLGNHAQADGSYVPLRPDRFEPALEETDAVLLAERAAGHALRPGAVSRYWWRTGLAWWARSPRDALRLTLRKLALLWGPWELADAISVPVAARWIPPLRLPLGAGWLLPLALLGLWMTRGARHLWPLRAFLLGSTVAIVPFFLFERFRLHLVAAALPFAAGAVVAGAQTWRARRFAPLGLGIAATAAIAFGLAQVRAPRDEVVLRVNIGEMLFQAGRFEEALAEYDAVRVASPDAWRVDLNVANTHAARGDDAKALEALARVIPRLEAEARRTGMASSEELAGCHELAGDLEAARGNAATARTHYDAALAHAADSARAALRSKRDALPP